LTKVSETDQEKEVAARREPEAARLHNQGWSRRRIADHLGVTPQDVNQILRRIDQRYLRSLPLEDVAMFESEIDQQLCPVEEEAFDAWHQSKEPPLRVRRTTDARGNGITTK